jgi:putative FmdB family regulatory protein
MVVAVAPPPLAWHSLGQSASDLLPIGARWAILIAMPIYEYRCADGHEFEVIQRFSDDPLDACEVCGKPAARVYHPPAVHFKGSGFYNTDYGTRKRAKEKEAQGAESPTTDAAKQSTDGSAKPSSGGSDAAAKPSVAGKPAKAAA